MALRRIALLLLVAACGKGGGGEDSPTATVLAAWKKAGLEPGAFEPVDGKFSDARCRAGKVSGIEATVCEFNDVGEAKRAESTGLASIKDTTGLALAEGKLLLVLADRGHGDPTGKRMNEIAKAFRNR